MRLTIENQRIIKEQVLALAGQNSTVKLFGSRIDDSAKGGDIDLLVTIPNVVDAPASLAAKLSAKLMRKMDGRKVDVLLKAPNLKVLPIHEIANKEGVIF